MNCTRGTSRSTRSLGCLTTLAALGALAGCSNAADTSTRSVPVAPEVTPHAAAEPVYIPVSVGSVRLERGAHPFARPELDDGRLDPEMRIENLSLFFALSPEQRVARDTLAAAQVDPSSPKFRQWLTPETYRAAFGARPEDIARASAWLKAQGFDLGRTSRLGTRVSFAGKVKDLETAFQTEMHRYVVNGETHYAMATAPAIPLDLAPVVLGVHNTHDFYKKPVSSRLLREGVKNAGTQFKFTYDAGADAGPDAGHFNVLAPPDWTAAYDVNKLYSPGIGGQKLDGTGVTIGIVGTAPIAQSDIEAFRKEFNIPALGSKWTLTVIPGTGPANTSGRGESGIEAILDNEWSGAIATGASINFVITGEHDHNVDDATFYLIEENIAPVMSESFGGCEAGSPASDADILEENGTAANLLGITYMAAAGDDGAEDCGGPLYGASGLGLYVDMPGSFPGVTSVGGTQFPDPAWNAAGNLTGYPTVEAVWNEFPDPFTIVETPQGPTFTSIASGGGGISSVFPRPAYQSGISTCTPVGSLPVSETPSKFRQVPDLAVSAASETPGYLVACTLNASGSDCLATGGNPVGFPIGGTSAASPSFAGVVAIMNQAAGSRLGNINPLLYSLAANTATKDSFHDITVGSNEIACSNKGAGDAGEPGDSGYTWGDAGCTASGFIGYPATTGYDCASGLGSIDGFNLVSAVAAATTTKTSTALTAAPNTAITPTTQVTLTADVTALTANANDLTGNVTFTFESYTPTGGTDLSWELGTVALTNATSSSGTVTLTTAIPPGLVKPGHQFVDVIAFYGGDPAHGPSQSAKVPIGFVPLTLAITPETSMLAPLGMENLTVTGGTPPYQWFLDLDTTAGRVVPDGGGTGGGMGGFGEFAEANIGPDGGTLTVGAAPGYVEVSVLDSVNEEAIAYVTVGTTDAGPAPWTVGFDAAVPAPVDAGVDAPVAKKDAGGGVDATTKTVDGGKDTGGGPTTHPKDAGESEKKDAEADAGTPETSSGGCNCEVHGTSGRSDSSGAVGSLLFGLAFLAGRRRRR